ncbi:PRC-barrel domain-containing protein [Bosea sp. (in: a-proteobacteria)]|uniref:PRC-barrel domain-containing protein n=1 Tax=Bosea sp. (in: a-proteobacteria) TaxID=1871050 RepID=UPI0026333366|nr:PRC-barrel domain-containing protein [Bosea sp. (in: a-proteobacteria)]MCO5093019.1 PRC-barrel domain-containing protein [Bosea sp. (in: a-proteobacteria)]
MIRHHRFMLSTVGAALFATAAVAQTSAPAPTAPAPAAPAATQPVTTPSSTAGETNLAGQGKWRTSKLIGVDIYGPDDKKVGDVTEVIVDKSGKVEMVTIGVGGFLGIGSKDVAVPFDQVNWSDQPMAASAPAPAAPTATGTASGGGMTSAPAATAQRAPAMYPDHGKITLTRDQLKAAPGVTYSGT